MDLSKFQPQPALECISPEDREALADQSDFVIIEQNNELEATVWAGPEGLHLLGIMIEGKSCIVGFYFEEGEHV